MSKTALYRHYGADGALLYVGITDNLADRDRRHRAGSEWHKKVHETRVQWFDAREIAIAAERWAIRSERPLYNKSCAAPEPIDAVFLCPEISEFAAEVMEFGERHGLKPSTIMQNACRNGKTWTAITSGKDMTFSTARKVRDWMAERDQSAAILAGAA